MKELHRSVYVCGFALLSLLNVAGYKLVKIKAEEKSAISNTFEIENADGNKKPMQNSSAAKSQITAASVAGTYEYDTHKDGEGYDNELEIKDAGGGKLYVFISGSYIYRVGETQSFHEAEGKGDAQLRGSTANATLVDEEGNPCRATITFKANEARVKIPDTCRFNIALGGVYKKTVLKSRETNDNSEDANSRLSEINFSELMSYAGESYAEQVGEKFVIKNVPPSKLDKKIAADGFSKDYRGLFFLEEADDDGYIGNALLVARPMIDSLAANAKSKPATLRLTAALIESKSEIEIVRIAFVKKIEGLSRDGKVLWTATGGEPAKTKFKH